MTQNPYQVLGIPPGASKEQVQQAYWKLARRYHPDTNKSPQAQEKMQDINWAYQLLTKQAGNAAASHQSAPRSRNPSEPGWSEMPDDDNLGERRLLEILMFLAPALLLILLITLLLLRS